MNTTKTDMKKIEILMWMFAHLDAETLLEMKITAQIASESANRKKVAKVKQPQIND